jgi:metallophosphoesterase (TIGR00282 family)
LRILFIGDIVGRPGIQIVTDTLAGLRRDQSIDVVIANAENADGGTGITPAIYRKLVASGVDCITLGDHIYKKKEMIETLENQSNVVKPANYPDEAPGRPWTIVKSPTGQDVAVFSLLGRVFMRPVDCPFRAADRVLTEIPENVRVRICDIHAEATSDKQLLGRYLDGRVTACLGTHTHVATADEQVLPGGTAFQCDVGMTGPHESILGREIDKVMQATITFRPISFSVAQNDNQLNGALIDIETKTGRAKKIVRFRLTESQAAAYQERHD